MDNLTLFVFCVMFSVVAIGVALCLLRAAQLTYRWYVANRPMATRRRGLPEPTAAAKRYARPNTVTNSGGCEMNDRPIQVGDRVRTSPARELYEWRTKPEVTP